MVSNTPCSLFYDDIVKVRLKESCLHLQDNSKNEWAYQKAITIQTYRNYHPIPVPFNTISIIVMVVSALLKKSEIAPDKTEDTEETEESRDYQVSLL